ncbi:MAG: hypothetical protein ABR600_10205 [Actinomycetota bacterium]
MADIGVSKTHENGDSFTFEVTIEAAGSSSRHVVTLSSADYDAQGDRFSEPGEFVRRCMEYLLEREPKESILPNFDVSEIGTYFPDFKRDLLHPGG